MVATVKTGTAIDVSAVADGMALRAPQKALSAALALMTKIADAKSTLAVLGNVAIRCNGAEGTVIAATDLNVTLTLTAPAWYGGRGDFMVPAKQLAAIVKGAPGGEVTLARTGPGLRVESGGVDTTLIGAPARDFPKLPSSEGLTFAPISGALLVSLFESVLFSVCQDETRFHLNAIRLEADGKFLRAVSTDGHRLTLAQQEIGEPTFRPSAPVLVPEKAAREIIRLIKSEKGGACSVAVKAPHMFVRVGGFELACKLIDAQFPPYWQVIPKDHKTACTVARKPLIDALKRVGKMALDTRGVRLDFRADGTLKLTADHPDLGTTSEGLSAKCNRDITIGFRPKYLIEALTEIDEDKVTIEVGGELDPCVIRGESDAYRHFMDNSNYIGVVMPMRI